MTRQERKDQSRRSDHAARRDRQALAVACRECHVLYGPVEVRGEEPDEYLPGDTPYAPRPVQFVMTNNRDALIRKLSILKKASLWT